MLRFQQIDREMVSMHARENTSQKTSDIQRKIVSFVQEGIGALLAYLPHEIAINTLSDFINILDPSIKIVRGSSSN